ncbi:MAG: hypothetical protein Q8M79_07390 [Dehalococcoidia bacterium]|nr:hypothetical protein [Dehalococcoidia bacterium]
MSTPGPLHMAIDCIWLRRTIDSSRRDPYAMLCTHIVRGDQDCIGPFLEDVETNCGLWEPTRNAVERAERLSKR